MGNEETPTAVNNDKVRNVVNTSILYTKHKNF